LLTIWEAAFRHFQWRSFIFPAPSGVLDAMLNLLGINSGFALPLHAGWPAAPATNMNQGPLFHRVLHSELLEANLVSGIRLAVGFSISILLGAFLGIAMWRFAPLDEFLGPLFLGLQTLPSVCWVPLAVLLFGLSEQGILFVLVLGSAFGIAISLRDGLRTIPPLYRRAGLMLGADGWRLYRHVILPASMPALASSLRQGFSFAWRSLMGAELILMADRHGLGWILADGQNEGTVAEVVAIMIIMVVIGMLADRLIFGPFERRVHARFGLLAIA
jgi:NitT/TauT family transport system permease protein